MIRNLTLTLAAALAMGAGLPAQESQEKLPAGAKIARVLVAPERIELKHAFDYRQLLLTGVLEDGRRIDVTRMAKFDFDPKLVRLSLRGEVRPAADGKGEIRFQVGEKTGSLQVAVSGQKQVQQVSFVQDVMPVLSRMGCNAGTCHGSAKGKNGFQLSLRGYDPEFDHRALIDDIGGRRFNRAAPEKSLMLMKPAGAVPHVGGVLCQPGEPYYDMIKLWISQGVNLDSKSPRVVSIQVLPSETVIPLEGMKQQLTVLAKFADGKVRDVTAEAFLESSNTEVVKIEGSLAGALRRGETAVLARYEGNYAAATVLVMGDRSGFAWQPVKGNNWIDDLVYEKLKEVKVLPSDLCTDSEFLRRLFLDITGLPPEMETVTAFLADSRPSRVKREELVDRLVGSPEYVEHWSNKWADLLQVNRKFLGVPGATALRKWIRDSIAANKPYDTFCREILTAEGSNIDNPAASYYKILRDPTETMENTTHLFLGIRFNCNKCHDHPFERWTQSQYYTLSAFFAQVGRREDPRYKGQRTQGTAVRGALPLVEVISDAKGGEVKNERTGENAVPTVPYQFQGMPPMDKGTRRQMLAAWITSKNNPYFAKSYVNRVWSYLLGVGLIEPVDDLRAGNPPSNPQLLDRLTEEFVQSGFDVQKLIKTICKSRTYQHSYITNRWNQDDHVNYSHALARRLPAEVLYDAIHRAIGAQSRLPGLPPGSRAADLLDSAVPVPGSFLELFGKPPRESACECERTTGLLLGPVLNLVNGPVLADALRDPNNRLTKLLAREKDDRKVVEELYLSILCRKPTEKEIAIGLEALAGTEGDFRALQKEKDKRRIALQQHEKHLIELQEAWEKSVSRTPNWTVLQPEAVKALAGTTLTIEKDGSVLASGKNPAPETYTVTAHTNLIGITGVRLEVLADTKLPKKGPGRSTENGNFVLSEFRVGFAKKDTKDKVKPVRLTRPQSTFNQGGFDIPKAIDNNPATGWAIAGGTGRDQFAVFEVQNRVGFKDGTKLTFTLQQQFAGKEHNIGKFRISVTTVKPPILIKGATPPNITRLLDVDPAKRTEQQKTALRDYYRSIDPDYQRLRRAHDEFVIPENPRLLGAQDLAWALMNSPAFLFNH